LSKEALLFEKRSENFFHIGERVERALHLRLGKFLGAFFQKKTRFPAMQRALHHRTS
jgi:hypothetical protein